METLEELRKKLSNLDEERNAVYEKILELEQQELTNNFVVGGCYFNPHCGNFKKIIKVEEGVLYCIVIEDKSIARDSYYLGSTKYWKKITSHQFKDVYNAVIKDITDPDSEDNEESNFGIALKSIYNSINKEK